MPYSNGLSISRERARVAVAVVLVLFIQNDRRYSPLPAFGESPDLRGIHIYNRTAPELTPTESRPGFLGGPEFAFLPHQRWIGHLPK